MTPENTHGISEALASTILDDTLDGLEVDARAAFVMHGVERLPIEEVAETLGTSAVTVRRYLTQANVVMADCLQEAGCEVSEATIAALMAHARRAPAVAPEEVEAALAEIFGRSLLGPETPSPSLPAAPAPSMTTALKRTRWFERWRPMLHFAGGVVVGACGYALLQPSPEAPPPVVRTVVQRVVQRVEVPVPVHAADGGVAERGVEEVRRQRHRPTPESFDDAGQTVEAGVVDACVTDGGAAPDDARSEGTPSEVQTLEAVLFDQALRASGRSDLAGVLDARSRYLLQFPQGARSDSMECLVIRAFDRAGRSEDVREHAAAYLRRFPAGSCAGIVVRLQERLQSTPPPASPRHEP